MRTTTRKETRKGRVGESRLFLASMLTVVFLIAAHASSFASSLVLQWDADTDPSVTGYKVYYQADTSTLPFQGTGAVEGTSPIDVHNLTTATISGLDPAHAYYFAVTAYNASGVESSYSNIANIPESTPTVDNGTTTPTVSSPTTALTINDALTALQIAVGKVQPTSDQMTRLDVAPYINGTSQPDGKIDIGDVIVLLGKVTGKIAL